MPYIIIGRINGVAISHGKQNYSLEFKRLYKRLKRSTFFYHLAEKTNKDAGIFHENNGNCGYRRILLLSCRVWTNNHTKAQAIMEKLGLKEKCKYSKYYSYQGEMSKIIIFWNEISKPLSPNFEQISRMMYQAVERLDGTKPI